MTKPPDKDAPEDVGLTAVVSEVIQAAGVEIAVVGSATVESVTVETAAVDTVETPAMRLLDLETRHRTLDQRIAQLYDFPYLDQIELQRLKKEKLKLKDAIERLKDEMIPDLNA